MRHASRASILSLLSFCCLSLNTFATQTALPPGLSLPPSGLEANLGNNYFGELSGNSATTASGNSAYEIPIKLPAGVGGFKPNLSLRYNSGSKNGPLGIAWSLSGLEDQITRCAQNLAQDGKIRAINYSDTDRFCLNGMRLVATVGTYGASNTVYKTESDRFLKAESFGGGVNGPDYFVVKYKNGSTKYYGHTTDSRIEVLDSNIVRLWAVNKIENTTGNTITYQYTETQNAQAYFTLYRISYAIDPSTNVQNTIEFKYETRPEMDTYYQAGSGYENLRDRLTEIDVRRSGKPSDTYTFSYENVGAAVNSRLTTITYCSKSNGYCLPELRMAWRGTGVAEFDIQNLSLPKNRWPVTTDPNRMCPTSSTKYNRWHDFDGDGKAEYLNVINHNPDGYNGIYGKDGEVSFELLFNAGESNSRKEIWQHGLLHRPESFEFVDINQDGKTDALVFGNGGVPTKVAISTGSGFTVQDWGSVPATNFHGKDLSLKDMNGDGRLDQVAVYTDTSRSRGPSGVTKYYYQTEVYVSLNTGTAFSPSTLWIADNTFGGIADANGDGLPDYYGDYKVRYNNGSSFDSPVTWNLNPAVNKDINGDGLIDYVSGGQYRINTGKALSSAVSGSSGLGGPDLNRDGFSDGTITYHDEYHGTGSAHIRFGGGKSVGFQPRGGALVANGTQPRRIYNGHSEFQDIDGDGRLDFSIMAQRVCYKPYYWTHQGSVFGETGAAHIAINKTKSIHQLNSITSAGNSHADVEFEYKSIHDSSVYTPGTGSVFPLKDVKSGREVVTKIIRPNSLGGENVTEYMYEGLKREVAGRGDLGFKKIIATNSSKGITTETTYAQQFPIVSRPTKVERFETASNRLLSRSETEYQVMGVVGSGPVFPYVKKHTQQNYDLNDGRLLVTAITNNTVDTYGNVTATDTATADHETGVTFNNQTNRQYTIDLVNWRVGQLAEQTQSYGINGAMDASYNRTTQFQYNTNGLLNRTLREPGAGAPLELTVDYSYNALGLVTQKTVSAPGVATRSFTTEYDSYGLFPIKVTNALGHETSQTWDYKIGKPLTQTDANGLTTTFAYNSRGGLTQTNLPDGTNIKYEMRLDNSGQNPGAKFYVEVIPTGKPAQRTFYDMLGRPIRSRSQSFDGSFVQQDTQYDAQGRVYRVSEPYFVGDSITWNTTSFDALGRVTQINAADNTNDSSLSYDGFKATLTDVNNRQSSSRTDVRGAIVEAIDRAGTKTQFAYNAAGLRTSVTNAVGLTKQFSVHYQYDRLGRMTQQDDPSHGIYTYEYDALGQKLKEVSPKMYAAAQSVQFQYDLLGRMTSRTEPEGTSSWSFDNVAGGNIGIGRLHQESMTGFSRSFEYAAGQFGRATAVNTQILQTQYRESMSYDADGNLDSLTYPASNANPTGFKVRYQYNDLGFVERLTNGSATETYYQMVGADAVGRITQQWLGDGSSQTQAYEVNSSRLSSQQTTAASGTTVQSFLYQYDTSGNMVQRQDVENNLSEVFTFDNLDRLTSAKVGSHTAATYGFDAVDNIVSKSDVGVYGYSALAVNAVSQTVLAGQTDLLNYDSNGNFFAGDAMPTVTWASYNKPLTLSKDSSSYEFKYGPSRQRYRQEHESTAGTKITHYVGSNFEVISNGPKAEYRHLLRANGRVVMMRRDVVDPAGNEVKHEYLHRDHLGSITAVTKEDGGSAVATMSYDAWGKRRDATDWNSTYQASAALGDFTRGYTGHEHLDDVGIIHMNGRVYSAELGKMMSPDPVTAEPDGGRNYNRYTYAYNNPLRYVDLTGYIGDEPEPAYFDSGLITNVDIGIPRLKGEDKVDKNDPLPTLPSLYWGNFVVMNNVWKNEIEQLFISIIKSCAGNGNAWEVCESVAGSDTAEGPGSVFGTIDEAASDALLYISQNQEVNKNGEVLEQGGDITKVDDGFTYNDVQTGEPGEVGIKINPNTVVAWFHTHPPEGSRRVDRLNRYWSPRDRRTHNALERDYGPMRTYIGGTDGAVRVFVTGGDSKGRMIQKAGFFSW